MVTLEAILERNNLNRAYKQVKANRGGPGVDGMTVDDLLDYLRAHAVEIVETVKAGKYKPQPVRRVMIPKEEKGKFRPLGIPTAVDRVIQQAIAQKLSDEYEPVFSLHSHGFCFKLPKWNVFSLKSERGLLAPPSGFIPRKVLASKLGGGLNQRSP